MGVYHLGVDCAAQCVYHSGVSFALTLPGQEVNFSGDPEVKFTGVVSSEDELERHGCSHGASGPPRGCYTRSESSWVVG